MLNFTINTATSSNLQMEVSFGDGSKALFIDSAGHASGNHTYNLSGKYTIKAVLINGSTRVDSMHKNVSIAQCQDMYLGQYYDMDSNCIFDAGDFNINVPVKVAIDSAGYPIDTLSMCDGIYYHAYGTPGTIYSFSLLQQSTGLTACSSNALIDTVNLIIGMQKKYLGFICSSATTFDLSVNAIVPVTGVYDQWGNIYVNNNSCLPTNATVTLSFSPKYVYGGANPAPTSHSGNTITWNVSNLSDLDASPVDLYYYVVYPYPDTLTGGDTVHENVTVTPISGDSNPSNNTCAIVDTVRDGCDPNQMIVNPQGNILAGTTLQYNLEFENTGNDTAFNIHALDTFSDYLDIKSFQLLSVTAPMDIEMFKTTTGNNAVKFDFPGINLLDSSHHNACTAMVSFSIWFLSVLKQKPACPMAL